MRRRSGPRFFPAPVQSVIDALLRANGGYGWNESDPCGTVRFSGYRSDLPVPDAVVPLLTGLRGALCNADGTWTWAPDPTDDVALVARPYESNLYLLRAS